MCAHGLENLRADSVTGNGRWQLGGLPPIELKSSKLSIDDNGAAGTDIELKLPFASGVISGTANLAAGTNFMDRSLRGELKIDMPALAWLRLVTTEVSSAEGPASGRLQLDGTLADPPLQGHVQLSHGTHALVTPAT